MLVEVLGKMDYDSAPILEGRIELNDEGFRYLELSKRELPLISDIPRQFDVAIEFMRKNDMSWFRKDGDYVAVAYTTKGIILSRQNKNMKRNMASEYFGKSITISEDGEQLLTTEKSEIKDLIFPVYEVSQDEFRNSLDFMVDTLRKRSDCAFDCIVGVSRSGLIPATYLAYLLGVENLYSFNAHSYPRHKTKMPFDPFADNPERIEGKNILLVDNMVDSGFTLKVNLDTLLKYNPRSITTCASHYLAGTTLLPDLSAVRLPEWRWVCFPWDSRNLKESLLVECTEKDHDRYLKEKYLFESM